MLLTGALTKAETARRLKEEETTLADVLDRLREELAIQYLNDATKSLSCASDTMPCSDPPPGTAHPVAVWKY